MDWQEGLDTYLAWTQEQRAHDEAYAEAQARITMQRALALAAMRDDGKSVRRIAWLAGLSKTRVDQLLAVADAATADVQAG